MTVKNRNLLYWLFKLAGILVSCAFPIWAITEKFPIWREQHGATHSFGIGFVLIIIVVLIIFRKTVFDFIKDHFNLKHAPPLAIWIVLLVVSYIFVFLGDIMQDMTTVLWMGFIGCCIGNVFTYISERIKGKGSN